MSAIARNNVKVSGTSGPAMIFAHGFGCDHAMWRLVAPAFEDDFQTVLFDHVGAGGSDIAAYEPAKYSTLGGYVQDLVEIGQELGLQDAVFVGHSVSAMIGILASQQAPGMFSRLVLVGPSPRYIDDGEYVGGFAADEIEDLLASIADNHMGWSASMGPAIMGNPDRQELGQELTASFCRTDPKIAKDFARVTFTSDNRADLPKVTARTLVMQCREDIIASKEVGIYVHRNIPDCEIAYLDATGHCPHLSAPAEVIATIRAFV